jgi:hypothetical protein
MKYMDEQKLREIIRQELAVLIKDNRYVFSRPTQILDGRNIQLGRATGTEIGTADDQKIGFYGTTPIEQQAAITTPTGGTTVDSQARESIGLIVSRLQLLGLTK